ncbi:MAG TPA: DNA-processing protein DprA [Elusimicrobiales bacterium]|nr:DNA-processing protein DprA [Elusimicrobiales bacterium]
MELKEKKFILKLNYALNYSNTDWVIDLLEKYKKPSLLFENNKEILLEAELLAERFNKFIDMAKNFDSDKEIEECEKRNIKIIAYLDPDYPQILKNINNPPIVLYVMGEIKDMPSVSIVGTRHPTDYGAKNTAKISYDRARIGLRVVSGLARGIDTVAHKAAIKAKGVTIAVIGSGLNNIYPPENKELAEIISSNRGAVISEYPLFSKPLKNNFPRRNRIISALSFATLVIEGDFNSGALITARYAVEQGREVMALPGSVDSRFSNGPNSLIKEGAYLVRNAKDIIELIPSSELFDIDLKKLYKNEEKEINLSPKGNIVYEFLKTKKEATVDEISAALNIEISELFNYLFELETSGAVTLFAGKYKINI